ncbi:unnamed protein product [Brassica oleracea]
MRRVERKKSVSSHEENRLLLSSTTKQIVGGSLRRSKLSTCPEFQTTPSGLRCDCCEITGVDAKMKGSHYPSSHHHHLRRRKEDVVRVW